MDIAVNKKDYLKKYLSGSGKKKKKLKTVVTSSSTFKTSKIVDDDLDLRNMRPLDENELEIYDLAEDAPQIAGIIDERPDDLKVMSQYRETKKWKVVTREYEDVQVSAMGKSDSDASPPRGPSTSHRREGSSDSGGRGKRKDDSDVSPPRRKGVRDLKTSPEKRKKLTVESDDDLSPPRVKRKSGNDVRNRKRDISPPRKVRNRGRQQDSDGDLSPPRKKKHDVQSPSQKRRTDVRIDSSPRRLKTEQKVSPERYLHGGHDSVRKTGGDERERHSKRDKKTREGYYEERQVRQHEEPTKKTLDGKKAGLQNATEMKKEAEELRRRQAESLAKLGDDVSGRGAAAIMRDRKTGRKRDLHEEAKLKREKDAKAAEIVEKYAVWGKGVKQIEDKTKKMKEDLHEMAKPVARYADDEDLEEMRRNEEKEGDPMLEYMRHKRRKEGKSLPVKQQYQGSYMPNRYNIKPGHRWDGVDRSNGYEKKLFEERNKRKALEEEAFKWSTEDM